MIAAVKIWLTSVITASLLLSAVDTLAPEGSVRRLASLAGGMLLAAALLRPFASFQMPELSLSGAETEVRTEAWEQWQADALRTEMAARTEALIRERTQALGTEREVRVELRTDAPIPWAAALSGPRDPALSAWLAETLDIPPERQTWEA